ncbi:RNA binding protein-like protein [Leishmania major strain Friedlin]|uniref:RNA binding protein-like protein n=1 Tax=Leishmania major TaxID=5664 RepID=Q4QII7_LEIMA|nr:RNA binding protein-like protein [Leishmania major strain Friedlin]CAJ07066.2 RNA binding protein-like protein [Leishmania major strain Friedlin]|eukprot:XP_001681011.2 RNA binding protein-like protein [Leishmania major strain Friedlin]
MMQEFHAFSVSPNKEHKLEIPEGCGFHLSVVSLPRGTNGKSTVYVSADGKSYALASLDSQQSVLQAPTDLIFNYQQQVTFFAKGSATVHCVGYRQELDLSDDDDDVPFAMESGSDDDTGAVKKAAVKLPADAITDAETAKRKPAAATESVSEDEEDEDEEEELTDSAEDASADAASDEGSDGEEMEEGEDEDEENDEEYDDDEIDSDIAKEPKGMQTRHVDPTAPSSEDEEDGSDGNDDEESDEEMDSDDLAAMEEDEEDVDDDDEEEAEPPMKVIRSEGRPSGGSPQGRPSAGGSPQGRPSAGGSPQGRPSAGGLPQGRHRPATASK